MEKPMKVIGIDAGKPHEIIFHSDQEGRKARAEWLKKKGMFDFVKIIADTFFAGKLPSPPKCYDRN